MDDLAPPGEGILRLLGLLLLLVPIPGLMLLLLLVPMPGLLMLLLVVVVSPQGWEDEEEGEGDDE